MLYTSVLSPKHMSSRNLTRIIAWLKPWTLHPKLGTLFSAGPLTALGLKAIFWVKWHCGCEQGAHSCPRVVQTVLGLV